MNKLIDKFLQDFPDFELDKCKQDRNKCPNLLSEPCSKPRGICPDNLGNKYMALCDEGFDITFDLCRQCWEQEIKTND